MKLYLQKQAVGPIWLMGQSLWIPATKQQKQNESAARPTQESIKNCLAFENNFLM